MRRVCKLSRAYKCMHVCEAACPRSNEAFSQDQHHETIVQHSATISNRSGIDYPSPGWRACSPHPCSQHGQARTNTRITCQFPACTWRSRPPAARPNQNNKQERDSRRSPGTPPWARVLASGLTSSKPFVDLLALFVSRL